MVGVVEAVPVQAHEVGVAREPPPPEEGVEEGVEAAAGRAYTA